MTEAATFAAPSRWPKFRIRRDIRGRYDHSCPPELRSCATQTLHVFRIPGAVQQVRDAFPATDGVLRGVRGGYEARFDREHD